MSIAPRLTVVMPTFNGSGYLEDALDSLSRQASRELEVIVVDDGSTDLTVAIAETYESRLQIRVIRPEPRRNWVSMVNVGLAEAKGEWTSVLHQDDLWLSGRVGWFQDRCGGSEAVLIVGEARFIDDRGRGLGRWTIPALVRREDAPPRSQLAAALYVQNWIAVPSATFRTAEVVRLGGLDEALWYTADWDCWLRLAQVGAVRLSPTAVSAFRVHASSQTIRSSADSEVFRDQMLRVQGRHRWAAEESRQPERVLRAGRLSTTTNVLLAGLMHGDRSAWGEWLEAARRAGARGATLYLQSSAIRSRAQARALSMARGGLDAGRP